MSASSSHEFLFKTHGMINNETGKEVILVMSEPPTHLGMMTSKGHDYFSAVLLKVLATERC